MNATFRKSLLAGAIAALVSSPTWAAGAADKEYEQTPSAGEQTTQPDSSRSMDSGAAPESSSPQAGAAASTTNPLYSMTPQQLSKMDVVDATGEDIGDVHKVVRGGEQDGIQVVISSGGVMGIGDKKVAVSLDDLQLIDDKLHLSSTKQELEAKPEYKADQYVELTPPDQPISEFAAFEPVPDKSAPAPSRDPMTPSPTPSPADPAQGESSSPPASPTPGTAPQ